MFEDKMEDTTKGSILIFFSALMFGSYGVWSRLIGDSFGVFYQGWSRALIITVILLPFLLWKGGFVGVQRKDRGWMCVYLFFTSLTQAPLFYAFNHMDIGSATLLFFVSMLVTMGLVGILFLGERLTKIKKVSFLLAGLGMYFVFSFSLENFSILAAIMAVANGIASGAEVSFSKKLSGRFSPLYLTWLSWVVIAVTHAPISVLLGEPQLLPSLNVVWLYQSGYVLASILGFWLIIYGLKFTEAGIGGLIGILEIVFSVLFGVALFGEVLTLRVLSGALLIMAAAALPHVQEILQRKVRFWLSVF